MHLPWTTTSLGLPLWIIFFFASLPSLPLEITVLSEWITFYDETEFATELILNWIFVHSQSDWSSVPYIHYTHIILIFILSFCVSVFTFNGLSWYWQTLWTRFLGIVGRYCFLVLYFAFNFLYIFWTGVWQLYLDVVTPYFFVFRVIHKMAPEQGPSKANNR